MVGGTCVAVGTEGVGDGITSVAVGLAVKIEQGNAIIHLTGTIMLGGACDAPRVQAQIEQTALQFSTVSDVTVFVNDVPLEDVLSSR